MKMIQKALIITLMALTMSMPTTEIKAETSLVNFSVCIAPPSTGVVDVVQGRSHIGIVMIGTDDIQLQLVSPTGVSVYNKIVNAEMGKATIPTIGLEPGMYRLTATSEFSQQSFEVQLQ